MKNYTDCTNYMKGLCKDNDIYCNERCACFCQPLKNTSNIIWKDTSKEAIKSIESVLNSEYRYDESLGYQLTSDDFGWLETAKEAIEKQIPNKPIMIPDSFGDKTVACPDCKNPIVNVWNNSEYRPKYCHYCGKALDWSDIE